jgi:hypothetical protein
MTMMMIMTMKSIAYTMKMRRKYTRRMLMKGARKEALHLNKCSHLMKKRTKMRMMRIICTSTHHRWERGPEHLDTI